MASEFLRFHLRQTLRAHDPLPRQPHTRHLRIRQQSLRQKSGTTIISDKKYIHKFVNLRAINTELALLLEAALGISANIWLKLQADYNMQVAKADSSFMNRLANIRKIAAML